MDTGNERAERDALLERLLGLEAEMETSIVPDLIEPFLQIRLTTQQLKVLVILVTMQPDGTTVQALARDLEVSLATMSGIVDRLATQEMVERVEDPRDHRVRRVLITDGGRAIVQQLLSTRPQMDRAPLERLALDDLRALAQGLGALLAVMKEERPRG
ncbi:MarR family winged helix-turn-helix transcriptional regulator [Agromyces archimandritae]|uniref:MarR family transcriptional regulator n=1 Tax=Agromyces archimandritae TaxID=2781962 RepID=A0A975IPT0_9MICO|nr:MarR family transcriptional regulator [Agromyces archimandritae]QTX05963.1 MarR family transcriptional regulator [Agromyces archimandritae]